MVQLADRIHQVKYLKAQKARSSKYTKKEKVAYVKIHTYLSNLIDEYVEEREVHVAEQKQRPPYVYKLWKA